MEELTPARPESIDALAAEDRAYVLWLERRSAASPVPLAAVKSWPFERWIALVSFVGVVLVSIFGAGARWHDVDLLSERVKAIEQRQDQARAIDETLYVRRDVNAIWQQSIGEKLDSLILDMKTLKAASIK